jgi:hypothetical protein
VTPIEQHKGGFFQHTRIPEYKDFQKCSGKQARIQSGTILQFRQWNNRVVWPVSPISIVKYLFVNGVPIDDMLSDFDGTSYSHLDANNDGHNLIKHVCQNQRQLSGRKIYAIVLLRQGYQNQQKLFYYGLVTGRMVLVPVGQRTIEIQWMP